MGVTKFPQECDYDIGGLVETTGLCKSYFTLSLDMRFLCPAHEFEIEHVLRGLENLV